MDSTTAIIALILLVFAKILLCSLCCACRCYYHEQRERERRQEIAAVVPAAVLTPADIDHVVGEVLAEAGVRQDLGAFLLGLRVLVERGLPEQALGGHGQEVDHRGSFVEVCV